MSPAAGLMSTMVLTYHVIHPVRTFGLLALVPFFAVIGAVVSTGTPAAAGLGGSRDATAT